MRARFQRRVPMVQYATGRLAYDYDRVELAEIYFKRALQIWPDCGAFHLALGDALKQQFRWQEASSAYYRAIATEAPGDTSLAWAYHNLGEVEARQQHWELAIAAYEIASERQPEFFYTHYNLAQACIQAGRFKSACVALEQAIALRPNDPQLWSELAQICAQTGDLSLRRTALERLITFEPQNFQAHFDLAGILLNQQEPQRAAEVYLQSLDIDPDFSWWYHHYFWMCLKDTERLDDAIAMFERHIQEFPDRSAPYVNFGEALVHRDRIPESLAPYRAGLRQKLAKSKPHYPIDTWDDQNVFGPNFIILGAQKAGTSSLFKYAIQHPQIIPPLRKELEFWSRRMNRGLDWYLSQFPAIPPGKETYISGEACPGYLDHDVSAERLRAKFPETKLIVILRNPVDRAYSHYNHWLRRQQETRDFETAIQASFDQLSSGTDGTIDEQRLWNTPHDYLARGVYVVFLKHWMSVFPRDRFLILSNEQLNRDPQATLSQVFDFLELPDAAIEADLRHNVGSYLPISDRARQLLERFYTPYNQALETFLDHPFHWS
jgi:tetratricopeptide (TPR) repeat protein